MLYRRWCEAVCLHVMRSVCWRGLGIQAASLVEGSGRLTGLAWSTSARKSKRLHDRMITFAENC